MSGVSIRCDPFCFFLLIIGNFIGQSLWLQTFRVCTLTDMTIYMEESTQLGEIICFLVHRIDFEISKCVSESRQLRYHLLSLFGCLVGPPEGHDHC